MLDGSYDWAVFEDLEKRYIHALHDIRVLHTGVGGTGTTYNLPETGICIYLGGFPHLKTSTVCFVFNRYLINIEYVFLCWT